MKISILLIYVGPIVGLIAIMTLINKYPVIVGIAILGALIYLLGIYLKKKGK